MIKINTMIACLTSHKTC